MGYRYTAFGSTVLPDLAQEIDAGAGAVVSSSRVKSWLPTYTLKRRGRTIASDHALVQCRDVSRPVQFSGLGMLTVSTIDMDKGLAISLVTEPAVATMGDVREISPAEAMAIVPALRVDDLIGAVWGPTDGMAGLMGVDSVDPGRDPASWSADIAISALYAAHWRGLVRLAWLLVHGPDAFGLSAEESLWFHFERNEDRDRGVAPFGGRGGATGRTAGLGADTSVPCP